MTSESSSTSRNLAKQVTKQLYATLKVLDFMMKAMGTSEPSDSGNEKSRVTTDEVRLNKPKWFSRLETRCWGSGTPWCPGI